MDTDERLAVVEERLMNHINETEGHWKAAQEALDEIKADLAKYRGFVGGVTFVVSALFTVLMLVKEKIFG